MDRGHCRGGSKAVWHGRSRDRTVHCGMRAKRYNVNNNTKKMHFVCMNMGGVFQQTRQKALPKVTGHCIILMRLKIASRSMQNCLMTGSAAAVSLIYIRD